MQPSSQRFTRATFLQCRCLVPRLALLRQKKRHVYSSQCTVSTILSINCADSSLTPLGFVETEEEASSSRTVPPTVPYCVNRTVSTVPPTVSTVLCCINCSLYRLQLRHLVLLRPKKRHVHIPVRQLEVVSTLPTLSYRTVLTVPYCNTKLVLPTVLYRTNCTAPYRTAEPIIPAVSIAASPPGCS